MSSSEEVNDPLQSSSQDIRQELAASMPETGITSKVFNLSSYDMHEVKDELEKTQYCCELDRTFQSLSKALFIPNIDTAYDSRSQPKPVITIEDATKAHDMSGKPFTTYLIKTTLEGYRIESKHRYSEFETLRLLLQSMYPSVIVPPLPGKHSVAQYAAKPGKALQDPAVIMKRKRYS